MYKGKTTKSLLLISIVSMTACSQPHPKVQLPIKIKEVETSTIKIKRNNKLKILTQTNFSFKKENKIEKSNWTPFTIKDEIEWNAKELLGKKYVWGATGPSTYDCSGFTQKIYGDIGIKIPRVSRNQALQGQLISFENLQKGDMVFFDTNRKKPGMVTHVGIYLGNGDFIHASSAVKKIVICNFKTHKFYKKQFLWGRRVIQEKVYFASNKKEFSSI